MQLIHMKSTRRRIAAVISFLLLASMACSFQGAANPTLSPAGTQAVNPDATATSTGKTPTQAPTAKPAVKSSEKLPPALVETDPPSGSRIGRSKPVTFYFNQPMQRSAVEAALQGDPAPAGHFDWLDDATMRFTPDHAYPAAIPIQFNIATTATAANGLAMLEKAQVQFETAGPLKVSERLPKPGTADANPSSAIIATFTEPVVDLGGDAAAKAPAFTLAPENAGKGEWVNTSTYIFYPQPALKGGLAYTVTLNPELKSTSGGPLALDGLDPAAWSFTTARPQILSATFGPKPTARLDPEIVITFNQPMNTASVEQNFHLIGPAGSLIDGKFTWDTQKPQLTFKPGRLLDRDTRYTIQVLAPAAGDGGTPLGADFNLDFTTLPALRVSGTNPAAGQPFYASFGYGTVTVEFSAPLKAVDFGNLVQVEPSVSDLKAFLSEDGYSLTLNGGFVPSTKYTFHLSTDIQDIWGMTLGHQTDLSLVSQAAQPALMIPAAQTSGQVIFISDKDTSLQAVGTNISTLNLEVGKIDLATFQALQGYKPGADQSLKADNRWDVPLELAHDSTTTLRIPFTPNRGTLAPGLYYLRANAPELGQNTSFPYLLVVGRIQLTLKAGPKEVTVWAVDLPGQTALPNQKVTFYGEDGKTLGTCTTDQDGLCRIDLPPTSNQFITIYALTGQAGSPSFGLATTNMASGLGAYEYGFPTGSQDNQPLTYFYTDRPIYRPGQTVNFRGVLRASDNGRYTPIGVKEVEITVMPPFDGSNAEASALTTLRLPVSSYGTISGSFALPAAAAPGYYTLKTPTLEGAFGVSFQVAEYRKPEFDLQAAFGKSDYLAGDPITATLSARYYFDAPAGNMPVTWTLYAASDVLYLPNGLQTGQYDSFWLSAADLRVSTLGTYIAQGSGVTSPDGTLAISIPADAQAKIQTQRQTLTLEVSAVDESSLPVSKRTTAIYHPAKFYAGVRPEVWGGQAGQEQGFGIQTVDWQGQPSGNHSLSAKLSKVTWERTDPPFGAPGGPTYQMKQTPVSSTDFRTDGLGRARVAFTPPDPGVYQVEVSGEGALTQVLIWVGGKGSVAWPSLPDQRLRIESDSNQYAAGQTAKIRIPNPFDGKALALVTVERSRVMYQHVFEINDPMVEESIPVDALYAPNAYVSVTLIGRKADGSADFRQGYVQLNVKADALKLNVTVQPNTTRALPGEEIGLDLTVNDAGGKPVKGEFSVALVDKAVLALADANAQTILDALYGTQPLGVATSMNLANSAARVQTLMLGKGGGGGSDAFAAASTRTNFQDTAYWVGSVETGADGKASLKVRLPDNLTTWVADIRGLTADTLVGQATIEVVTSKDLLVRPVTPRFLVAGDHVRLGAIVQNNTSKALTALVKLEAPGLTLETSAPSQQVEVPAGDRRRLDWWVTVQDVDSVDPLFSVTAGDLSDSTRLEQGKLPVLRFKSPQTFATSGMLSEASERLEVISLPRSFTPTGGQLRVELSSSLAATVMESLRSLDAFPDESTEQIVSRLLPNLAVYSALKKMNLQTPDLETAVTGAIHTQLRQLMDKQNDDGGFGWNGRGTSSERYITSYVLFSLNQAASAGFFSNPEMLTRIRSYLLPTLTRPTIATEGWDLDQLAFSAFVLGESAASIEPAIQQTYTSLFELRQKLSPWAQALLAAGMERAAPANAQTKTIVSDLESSASRSASGVNWPVSAPDGHTWSTPNFSSAVVVYALARLDPAAPVLTDAVRSLVLNRQPNGCWKSSYETAWVLLGLTEALKSTGDLQSNFNYSADLNGTNVASGTPQTSATALKPVQATITLNDLIKDGPNALRIRRDAGDGRLYYRAFLEVDRPADAAPALERGISVRREYFRAGQDCKAVACKPVSEATLGPDSTLLVRVTVTLPQAMYYVVVEDTIPSGAEVINPNLKTSQQGFAVESEPNTPLYDLRSPFDSGWGWWLFGSPTVLDQGVRWTAPYLAAGTYELTYRIVPTTAGEFRVLPAHAYQNYFPDVEGTSAGSVFVIK